MAATTDVKMPILPKSQQHGKANWFDWKGKIITITPPPGADPGNVALARAEQQLWDKHDEFAKAITTLNIIDFIGPE
ncbi:uncharacterized protein LAESUDRAFT_765139 [Laetiporus sulphureus 93-53]|nr:uncharacterized protein LAESUDRAFT_765139 [Laetiporus sulphureus 93-53]KZS99867.1 hypothetical protein LAESUDRAFT_765139 [Laetiporus sulphureus 93-53]